MKIVLLGAIPENIVESARSEITRNYGVKTEVVKLPDSRRLVNAIRNQYRLETVIAELKKNFDEFVAITPHDIYTEGLAFTFGGAMGKAALVSIHRLGAEFYKKPSDAAVLRGRAEKKVVHEAGHVLGLGNCWVSGCAMNHANSIGDLDKLTKSICDNCRQGMRGSTF